MSMSSESPRRSKYPMVGRVASSNLRALTIWVTWSLEENAIP